jgi:hypothetical protein
VNTIGSAGQCRVGAYNAVGGLPTTLIVDAGTISVSGTGATIGTLSAPIGLAPQTLYFLAVDCNGNLTLQGAPSSSNTALTGPLIGASDFTDVTTRIYSTWTFASGPFPLTIAASSIVSAAGASPNVYAGP